MMMTSMTQRCTLTAILLAVVAPALLPAQSAAPLPASAISPAMDRAVARARAAVDNGDGADARAVLDSLVTAAPSGSNDLAEALFWRATLADRVSDAERDWKRLIIESPLAPRATDALLRLGELEMLRGHPADARAYFARVVREYPAGPAKARSQLWIAKSWVAQRDLPRACVALAVATATGVPDGELRLQAEELGRRCATVDRKLLARAQADTGNAAASPAAAPSAPAPAPAATAAGAPAATSVSAAVAAAPASSVPANARFSVQLAAFGTRPEAEAFVRTLGARQIDARVDGDRQPFRVRTGYFATRAEATAALVRFKRAGFSGFVAELVK
ncbi:SPOR domain-containing protein [Gemmatimonas sp.]|uniref:SPOR domain-containing protein n=1 Tax=Gemmatimonas sp. TaxID=1962908 RepID=UPI0025C58A0E|nr:SPOR domain-containing protein [Gemmatimonas sp.]MCA2991536.1 SPOR domain-containing protein [Gemmatimonas sp.]